MGNKVLALDLGGTNLRMAVVSTNGDIEHRERCSTPQVNNSDAIISAIADLAGLCQRAVAEPISVLGAAVPAILNLEEGRIEIAPNLPMLDGVAFESQLQKATGLQVVLENDATAAATGEHWLGASRGFENSICVTLGTGVGGGIIINGRPLRGPDGTAGEIGHICVEPDGHPCGCGSWGCVEQYASATAVVRMMRELAGEMGTSIDTSCPFTAKDVYRAATEGDRAAMETFRRMGDHLGLALAGLVNALNPEAIVIGGGMSAAWDMFIDAIRGQIMRRAFREPALRVKLVRAELGDDAGILGVASIALGRVDKGCRNSNSLT
jgi:glucokinase